MTTGWRSWAGAERFQGRRFQGRRFQGRAVPLLITMWGPSAVSRTLPSPHAVITVGPVEIAGSSAATRHQPFGSDPPPSTSSTPRHTLYPLHTLHIRACSADDPTSRRADEPTSRRADDHDQILRPFAVAVRHETAANLDHRHRTPGNPQRAHPAGTLAGRYPCGSPAVPPPHPPHSRDDQPRPDPWPDDGTDESGHHHHPPMAPGRSPATSGWVRSWPARLSGSQTDDRWSRQMVLTCQRARRR